jgi:outer membrane immunogenic protein
MASCWDAGGRGGQRHWKKIMSYRIVIRRSPPLACEPRRYARLAHLIATPAIAMAALLTIALTAPEAADLPTKAPPVAPTYNWGGCYVGVNGGAGGAGSDLSSTVGSGTHLLPADAALVSGSGTGSANATGFLGGGQAGCNWQSATVIWGLEGDFDYFHSHPHFTNNTDTLSDGVTPFSVTQSLKTDFFATVRPRIGIAADHNLGYITGGAAFSNTSYAQSYVDGATPPGTGSASGSKSLVGWTVGAGWEHAFADRWTFKLEYLFASFPTTNRFGAIADTAGGTNPLHGSADLVIQTLRAGVNFKF